MLLESGCTHSKFYCNEREINRIGWQEDALTVISELMGQIYALIDLIEQWTETDWSKTWIGECRSNNIGREAECTNDPASVRSSFSAAFLLAAFLLRLLGFGVMKSAPGT